MTDPAEVITATVAGSTFKACRFCAAHIADTAQDLPGLRIIQPPWNVGVPASAGTHDRCACFDVAVDGMEWLAAQKALRALGWAAWFRPYTPGVWGNHIHMVSLGCPAPKGIYVPGQIADYYDHRNGLAGHAQDQSWHPADIDATVFDYPAWLEEHDMTPEQDKTLSTIAATVARQEQRSVRQTQRVMAGLRALRKKVGNLPELDDIEKALSEEP